MSTVNEELRVVVDASDHCVRVKIGGELDVASSPRLRDVLQAAIGGEDGDVEVDMTMTTFCNSAGLAVLLAAQRQLHLAGRQLRILHASRPVLRLLELSDTSPLAALHPSRKPPPPAQRAATG